MKLEINYFQAKVKKFNFPIIFVHGAWHGAWCWEKKFVECFKLNGFDSIVFSFRNHGKSDYINRTNLVSIKDYVEDLRSIIVTLKVEPVIIAHSMGGMILQKYLEQYPCKASVLLASVPPSGVLRTTLKFIVNKWYYSIPSLLFFNLYGLVNNEKKAKWAFFSDNLNDNEIKEYSKLLVNESYLAFLGMLIPNIKMNFHDKIPMLVIAAENDNIFSVKQNMQTALKYSAEFKVIKDTAHDLMLEKTFLETSDVIIKWLNKIR